MPLNRQIGILVFTWIVSFQSCAVTLYAPKLLGLINQEGTGKYQLLVSEAFSRMDTPKAEEIMPTNRAIQEFIKNPESCIYTMAGSISRKLGEDAIVTSYPIGAGAHHIFTLNSDSLITEMKQLQGKLVLGVLGDDSQAENNFLVSHSVRLLTVASADIAINMLRKRRADALLGILPDFAAQKDLHYSENIRFNEFHDVITCHNNANGQKIIAQVSPVLKKMHQNGEYKSFLEEFYYDFQFKPVRVYDWGFAAK